jgi:glycosyltransferase involved in cell wall biosynthesis
MSLARRTIVLIPTYNEAQNIGPMVDLLYSVVPETAALVIDDHSPDGTADRVREKQTQYPRLFLLERHTDRGFAKSYLDGFRHALADPSLEVIVTMDADFSHEPKELPFLLALPLALWAAPHGTEQKPDAKNAPALPSYVQRVQPAVVGIKVQVPRNRPSVLTLGPERWGSGVIFDPSGYALTVSYVLLYAGTIEVSLRDGEIVLSPVVMARATERLKAIRAKIKSLGLTEKAVEEAIRWLRGKGR